MQRLMLTTGAGSAIASGAPGFNPVFSRVRVPRSLDLYVFFVDRCCPFVIFFGQLCCLSFFDLQIFITPLVSSNYS